ncbi:MAG: hypothetical protein ACLQK4_04020 [Acidimicrobiales bacterium]|jgi:hypothetical protein
MSDTSSSEGSPQAEGSSPAENIADIVGTADDPLVEAHALAAGARAKDVPLRLIGGLAVRELCPDFPPRLRRDQDIDFACLSKTRTQVMAYLEESGCEPDRRFNSLNGDRQMYYSAPSGRPIDVMVDRLTMCHTLDFRPRFAALPLTLDVADLLLTKLQIVELNAKDARDICHLLSAFPVSGDSPGEGGPESPEIDRDRFFKVLGADWGWWRTVTGNLSKLPLLVGDDPDLVPPQPRHDPLRTAERLLDLADAAPKSVQWKLRAKVGDRVRWYELPEEVAH